MKFVSISVWQTVDAIASLSLSHSIQFHCRCETNWKCKPRNFTTFKPSIAVSVHTQPNKWKPEPKTAIHNVRFANWRNSANRMKPGYSHLKPKIKSSKFSNLNYFNVNVYFGFSASASRKKSGFVEIQVMSSVTAGVAKLGEMVNDACQRKRSKLVL